MFCPDGQLKLPARNGPVVRLAWTRPFLASKVPPDLTWLWTLSLFAALRRLPGG